MGDSRKVLLKKVRFYFFIKLLLHTFCQNGLFATQPHFFNHWYLINGSFFRKVTFHMVNVERVAL